jgi:hypothetical protein
MLTPEQIALYEEQGFLLLRKAIDDESLERFDAGVARHPPCDGNTGAKVYPEPGRYTLAKSCAQDPELAFLAEHPTVVNGARELLGDDPRLTAYVYYDRTPGGPGIPSHNDYKRWRPVGSSMNWLFTIIPLSDFDAEAGQLFVAPGSHRLDRIQDRGERVLSIAPAIRPDEHAFIDPGLERGDLLFMNMHLWHRAAPNQSKQHRVGIFNKYAAANAIPATGYYLFNDGVYDALSDEGKPLIAVHSNKPIATTRILLHRQSDNGSEVLMTRENALSLPGGPTWNEQSIPDWDNGNYIAAIQGHMDAQLKIRTPWVSYVGDYDEGDHLCRIYAYDMPEYAHPIINPSAHTWMSREALNDRADELAFGWETEALSEWLRADRVRGKGLSQAQSRVDQYAY